MLYSYEKFLLELGAKVRSMRKERGWTFRHMIVAHGYHLAHWQGLEKGRGISVPSLLRLAEVFEMSLEELIKGLGVADVATHAPLPGKSSTVNVERTLDKGKKERASKAGSTPSGSPPRSQRRKQSGN